MNKTIAILAGDGIGPEIMNSAIKVLKVIEKKFKHKFNCIHADIGGAAYDKYGEHCPKQTLEVCQNADAILFGSVGGPVAEQHLSKWQNCETNSILKLRKLLNLNINIRPIKIYPNLVTNSPLKNNLLINKPVDISIFRELTGGIYFGEHKNNMQQNKRVASDECVYNEAQICNIVRSAFESALLRNNKLCSVDKANVLATSKLWREIVNEISLEYPDVAVTHMLVDNCAMQLIINPSQFDVIVTENMFGDIISDLAAAIPGSIGLLPSASLNDTNKGLFEPSGGSAPEIAGKNIANPIAQILSLSLLLRYSFKLEVEATAIEDAVKKTLDKGILTKDLAIDDLFVTTNEFTEAVINNILGRY